MSGRQDGADGEEGFVGSLFISLFLSGVWSRREKRRIRHGRGFVHGNTCTHVDLLCSAIADDLFEDEAGGHHGAADEEGRSERRARDTLLGVRGGEELLDAHISHHARGHAEYATELTAQSH